MPLNTNKVVQILHWSYSLVTIYHKDVFDVSQDWSMWTLAMVHGVEDTNLGFVMLLPWDS